MVIGRVFVTDYLKKDSVFKVPLNWNEHLFDKNGLIETLYLVSLAPGISLIKRSYETPLV